jgi:hypothetical protein
MRYVITQRFAFQLTVCSEKARKNTHGNNPTFRKFCHHYNHWEGCFRALLNRQGAKAAKRRGDFGILDLGF